MNLAEYHIIKGLFYPMTFGLAPFSQGEVRARIDNRTAFDPNAMDATQENILRQQLHEPLINLAGAVGSSPTHEAILTMLQSAARDRADTPSRAIFLIDGLQSYSGTATRILRESQHARDRVAFLAATMAGLFVEMPDRYPEVTRAGQIDGKSASFDALFIQEVESYQRWETAYGEPREIIARARQEVEQTAQQRDARAAKLEDHLKTLGSEIAKTKVDAENRAHDAENALAELLVKIDEFTKRAATAEATISSIETQTGQIPEQLESYRKAAIEAVRVDEARELWRDRGEQSALAFKASATVIVLLLLVVPVILVLNGGSVLTILQKINETTLVGLSETPSVAQLTLIAASRLILISIPVALYFWLIRLVVRFNLRSMAMMDDARQRQTLIDTYVNLIEQRVASKEDRALLLAAIFRPLPGHGEDNVEPPNFTELLQKGMGK